MQLDDLNRILLDYIFLYISCNKISLNDDRIVPITVMKQVFHNMSYTRTILGESWLTWVKPLCEPD